MSDSNNNINLRDISRRWENNANSYIQIDYDDDFVLESYDDAAIDRNQNPQAACVDAVEALHEDAAVDATVDVQVNVALSSPWPAEGQSNWQEGPPAPTILGNNNPDEEEFDSESESELEFLFEEAPPIHGIRFYNPNYQPPATAAAQATDANANANANAIAAGNATALPNITQVNNSRLDLRPVPASIDLTRNRPQTTTWRDYQARVRSTSNRLRFPESRPAANGVQRLCAGQPPTPVPMFMDEELGALVFFRNDTDSEEEPQLPPLAMVPRRGNSVSDLSQCSSDDEPDHK